MFLDLQLGFDEAISAASGTPSLSAWNGAVAGVKAGTRRATVLCIGDDTTVGERAGSGAGNNSDCYSAAWPIRMGVALAGAGVPCNSNGWMGDGGCLQYGDDYFAGFNSQMSITGTYSAVAYSPDSFTRAGLGASPIVHQKTAAAGISDGFSVAFTPGGVQPSAVTDKFRIYVHRTQAGSLSVAATSGAPVTIAITPIDEAFALLEFTAAGRASQGYSINANPTISGNFIAIQGGYAYDSATPAVDIINAGVRGASVTHWLSANSPHSYLNSIALIAPDLTIIMPPINDLIAGTSVATFTTQLQALITACKQYGDVMLVNAAAIRVGGPNGRPAQAVRDTYTAAINALAITNNLKFVDLEAQLGSWAANAAEYHDDIHPLAIRQDKMGIAIAGQLADLSSFIPSLDWGDERNLVLGVAL